MDINMKENFARISGVIIFFIVFIGLLSFVGNPAKEETIIIFIIAIASSLFIYDKFGGVLLN